MLEGRSDNRVACLEGPLEVSLARRLDVRTVGFRCLEFRLDCFEITVSPPNSHLLCNFLRATRRKFSIA